MLLNEMLKKICAFYCPVCFYQLYEIYNRNEVQKYYVELRYGNGEDCGDRDRYDAFGEVGRDGLHTFTG